jgi:hypothetical protein
LGMSENSELGRTIAILPTLKSVFCLATLHLKLG